jgi:hypothetical protein
MAVAVFVDQWFNYMLDPAPCRVGIIQLISSELSGLIEMYKRETNGWQWLVAKEILTW